MMRGPAGEDVADATAGRPRQTPRGCPPMDSAESETETTRETETPSKPRRPPSPARLNANRANARKSTGPRTPEGKMASRLNGVTHGMCCTLPVVLPGEDAGALRDK